MVVQKVTCSCETDFHATAKTIYLVRFSQSCEIDTPFIPLCVVIFNHPYLPRFNSDLHTFEDLNSWILKLSNDIEHVKKLPQWVL